MGPRLANFARGLSMLDGLAKPAAGDDDAARALDEARAKREGSTVEAAVASAIAAIPAGRYGDPDEYAAAVAFLAGEPASYITGTTIRIDGGQIPSI